MLLTVTIASGAHDEEERGGGGERLGLTGWMQWMSDAGCGCVNGE